MTFLFLLYAGLLCLAALAIPRLLTALYAAPRVFTVESAPPARVAVVFGAGLQRDGSASPVLRDRVTAAARLYFEGKVEKLLMSGDNRFANYNEPGAMLAYALELGVPREAIVLDYAGRRTYDTCYRARDIFQVNDVLLVTQSFHLPRAVFTCNMLGLRGVGVSADQAPYRRSSQAWWHLREVPATLAALWDVWVRKPEPVLGNPEPIFSQQPDRQQGSVSTP